ncbi:hypothetical protein QJQ45_027332 [Haematococcus lacustris]|nr:hypothetical protein QJQ45_027332 [Haematococcus lacustris]
MLLGAKMRAARCEAIADSGGVCELCVLGKQHRLVAVQHPGLGLPAKRLLALVHNDVCSPFDCPTPSGNLYFVTVLDEYSGLVAVELIRQKSAAAQAIIAKGVGHQQTAPYSPEMNGSAERINRALEQSVRAMRQAAGTPKHLWGEAFRVATDLHNLSAVSGKPCTPHELMLGINPIVSHFRVWGCPAYVHDPILASKLDSCSVKGVYVGYQREGKSYRVWAGGRIYVSKSVVFEEQAVQQRFAPYAVLAPANLAAPPVGDASKGEVDLAGAVTVGLQRGSRKTAAREPQGCSAGAARLQRGSRKAAVREPHSCSAGPSSCSAGAAWLQRGSRRAAAREPQGCSAGAAKLQRGSHIAAARELIAAAREPQGCSAGAAWLLRGSRRAAAREPQGCSAGAAWLLRGSRRAAAREPQGCSAGAAWLPRGSHIAAAREPHGCSAGATGSRAVKFSDYLTVCYSARNVSCNNNEGVGNSGSREKVALVGSRAAAVSSSTKRGLFSKAMSRPEAEEWGRAMEAKMASLC